VRLPVNALVVIANGERCCIMRNIGTPLEPRLERVRELDLELTNFSAGVGLPDPARGHNGSTNLDELAHGAAIAEWLNAEALKGQLQELVIIADPKTLGQIRQHCHQELQKLIVGEIAKDLTNSPLPAIQQIIADA
jgi:protein required for attachment to host cells